METVLNKVIQAPSQLYSILVRNGPESFDASGVVTHARFRLRTAVIASGLSLVLWLCIALSVVRDLV